MILPAVDESPTVWRDSEELLANVAAEADLEEIAAGEAAGMDLTDWIEE